EVVDAHREARQHGRRDDDTEGTGIRFLLANQRIAALEVADDGVGLDAGSEYLRSGYPGRDTGSPHSIGSLCRGLAARARVGCRIEALCEAPEQLGNVRRANCVLILPAKLHVPGHFPPGTEGIGVDTTDAGQVVLRMTEGTVDRKLLDERQVSEN